MAFGEIIISILLLILIVLEVYRIMYARSSVTPDFSKVQLNTDKNLYIIPFDVRGYPPFEAVDGVIRGVLKGFKERFGVDFVLWNCMYERYGYRIVGIWVVPSKKSNSVG